MPCPAPAESQESTTSSVPSLVIGSEQFKPMGLKAESEESRGFLPPSNIPTTVLDVDLVGIDQMLVSSQAFCSQVSSTQGDTMEFELPPVQALPAGENHVINAATGMAMLVQIPSGVSITSPNLVLSHNQDAGISIAEEMEQISTVDVDMFENITDILEITGPDEDLI